MSALFDFNDLLNDVAPLSLISFPVDVMRDKKGDLFMDVYGVSSSFCLHSPG